MKRLFQLAIAVAATGLMALAPAAGQTFPATQPGGHYKSFSVLCLSLLPPRAR